MNMKCTNNVSLKPKKTTIPLSFKFIGRSKILKKSTIVLENFIYIIPPKNSYFLHCSAKA